jgi:hypothetical protein
METVRKTEDKTMTWKGVTALSEERKAFCVI